MNRRSMIILAATLVAVFVSASAAPAWDITTYRGAEVVAGELIVTVLPEASRTDLLAAIDRRGFRVETVRNRFGLTLRPTEWIDRIDEAEGAARYIAVGFDSARDMDEVKDEIAALPGVADVSPDPIRRLFFVPNDPFYDQYQTYLPQINVEKAWDRTRGKGVIVAVIDTGYVLSGLTDGAIHVMQGYDFGDNDDDPNDSQGHGTHVTNTIAHHTNNGYGAAGAAPEVTILPCKVFADGAEGARDSDIAAAIDWATSQGAHVINLSLGGSEFSGASNAATRDANEAGVVVFAASGNDGRDRISYPAGYEAVIAVGSSETHALDSSVYRSSFSNYGDGLEIVAPGNSIIAETLGQDGIGFYLAAGTSTASPHAAAAGALLIAALDKDYTPDLIREALQETARGAEGSWDYELGFGEINIYGAMEYLTGPNPNQPPQAGILTDVLEGPAPLTVQFTAAASDPDHDPLSILWSFSSGEVFHTAFFSHTFEEPGTYDVMLSVSDPDSAGDSAVISIEVQPAAKDSADEDDKGGACGATGGGFGAWLAVLLSLLFYRFLTRRGRLSVAVGTRELS
ncbi:MAG: S8 family serine peptidase [Candidatus Lernaella stagnicola]|nr:S8 family serine peptidase [Candidatus Lernaella stagnicola]